MNPPNSPGPTVSSGPTVSGSPPDSDNPYLVGGPFVVDGTASDPPFEQIRRRIAIGAADGSLAPGYRLPTVRQLAAELGVAVNTVARAYRELETDGIVTTEGRRGTFISTQRAPDAEVTSAASGYVDTARRRGLSRPEAIRLIERFWTR